MFQVTKKIVLPILIIAITTVSNVMAFDLEDYATTYRASRDNFTTSKNELAVKEAAYFKAFNDRMGMEMAVRIAQQQDAINAGDPDAQKAAEDEIKKLNDLVKSSEACGM